MGEYVNADEVVAVIETDKVNVDIRTTDAGVITKYFAAEGDTVAVDAQFFELDTSAKGGAPAKPKEEPKQVSLIILIINLLRLLPLNLSKSRRKKLLRPNNSHNLSKHPPLLLLSNLKLSSKRATGPPQK